MTESDRDILLQTIASKNRLIADLRATIARLEREYEFVYNDLADTVEDILCENITKAIDDADPDRQTPGQRTWHLYFDGLYNEMPY